MYLRTPDNLLYPITVTKLLRQPGDEIPINAPLFNYEYKSINSEWDEWKREHVDRERTWPATFESELEGTLSSLDVRVGQILTRRSLVAEVEEACKHAVQFGGLCADCAKDMNEINTYNESAALSSRATINTIHGRTELLVSTEEATRADVEAKRRLLSSRRLSLVVDLDQTIIHASVEPTIGEWQEDPSNPNHEAVRDVCKFQLVDDMPGRPGTWYYIKLRPGLKAFLETMSTLYEMHIYTMGTRAYAENIAKIIDPESRIFGDRILSRDESGSMTAKSLKRLFPVDTKMVVIIDDRADVWHWIPNLIKVNVYEFFVGIGDINGSFLPKRPELEPKLKTPTKREPTSTEKKSSESVTEVSAIDQIVSMVGNQDEQSIRSKEEEQEQTLVEQLEDRPLLRKQKILDALEEEEASASPAVEATAQLLSENSETKDEASMENGLKQKYRHNLLQDDDTELTYLERSLTTIHNAYYDRYDRQSFSGAESRSRKRSPDELELIPDAAVIMNDLKQRVLDGLHLVFSGVVPLGVDAQSHDLALWAKSFGATVSDNIYKKTTHVIASPDRRTAKVRQAAKRGGRIAIVNQHWLMACFSQWKRVDEDPYRIHADATSTGTAGLPESFEKQDYPLSSSDEEAAQTEEEIEERPNGSTLDKGLLLDTEIDADEEEWEQYKPTATREDSSPQETENADDWDQYDDELAEFLGSEADDDSDTESVRTDTRDEVLQPSSQQKRKQSDLDAPNAPEDGNRVQKRRRRGLSRTTSLTSMSTARNGPEGPMKDNEPDRNVEEEQDDGGESDLEAALAAEMEKQSEEDEAAARIAEKSLNGGS